MARTGHLEDQKSMKLSTYAVLFLGTPHQGGQGIELAQVLTKVLSAFSHTNERLLKRMKPNSDWLMDLQKRYNAISQDFKTVFFYETLKMPVPLLGRLLVSHQTVSISASVVECSRILFSGSIFLVKRREFHNIPIVPVRLRRDRN